MVISHFLKAFAVAGCLLWIVGCTTDTRSSTEVSNPPADNDVVRSQGGQEELDTTNEDATLETPPTTDPADGVGPGTSVDEPSNASQPGESQSGLDTSGSEESATPGSATE